MRGLINAALDGALRVADTLDDWIVETVSGFAAAAPIVPETAPLGEDARKPRSR